MKALKLTPEKIVCFSLALVGIIYLLLGRNLSLGTLRSPGEGLIPLVLGLLLTGTAIVILFQRNDFSYEKMDRDTLKRVLELSMALIVYILLMPLIGFKISTFIVIFYSSRILGNRKWLNNLVFSLVVVAVAVFLFENWLQLPLPDKFI